MPAPRMKIGFFGSAQETLAELLSHKLHRAGHTVRSFTQPEELKEFDLILCFADEDHPGQVTKVNEDFAPHARAKQIFIMISPDHSRQLVKPLIRQGSLAVFAYPLGGNVWLTTGFDTPSETVVQVFIEDIGGRPLQLSAQKRAALTAVMRQARSAEHLSPQITTRLIDILEDPALALDIADSPYLPDFPWAIIAEQLDQSDFGRDEQAEIIRTAMEKES